MPYTIIKSGKGYKVALKFNKNKVLKDELYLLDFVVTLYVIFTKEILPIINIIKTNFKQK